MGFKTWERRYRDDSGLPMRRRCAELTAGPRRLRLGLPAPPVLDAQERLFGRKLTREEVAGLRAERRKRPRVGDILLNDERHVAVCFAAGMLSETSINERGTANGDRPGDQTNLETRTRKYYSYTWSCYLRYVAAQSGGPSGTASELARRVIAGEFGNGDARKSALGARYAEVQAEVNRILAGGSSVGSRPTTDKLARAVIAGRYGVGEVRKKALGSRYAEVQRRMNELLR